jgi:hypothetical protein
MLPYMIRPASPHPGGALRIPVVVIAILSLVLALGSAVDVRPDADAGLSPGVRTISSHHPQGSQARIPAIARYGTGHRG